MRERDYSVGRHGWRLGVWLLALAVAMTMLLILGPMVMAQEQPPASTVEVLAGAGASLSDQSAPYPGARATVDAPLFVGRSAPLRLRVSLALSALPGETFDLRSVQTFKSAELWGELQRVIGGRMVGSSTYVVGRAGFVTRLVPNDPGPRDRFARVYVIGVGTAHRGPDYVVTRFINAACGRSEVAALTLGRGQCVFDGMARLYERQLGRAQTDLIILADSHLNIGRHAGRGARDVMRIQVMARLEL